MRRERRWRCSRSRASTGSSTWADARPPTLRYHPAVVAQKAATLGVLSQGRFLLNLGAGENLDEHVVGQRWPAVGERHDMLEEAVTVIRALLTGERTTWEGAHFRVDSARVWDVPDQPVQIGVAVSGDQSVSRFAPLADHLVAVEPSAELVAGWAQARPAGFTDVAVVQVGDEGQQRFLDEAAGLLLERLRAAAP
ncbi:LLM class flavin-dependent oxidoreductase [Cellulomonas sp. PSBB021]|uniref:LLM class flavin-dependent oxidoreductase n=1 Tax=Cellulomonas sp. PSBB021 TaxID=2003551 RepID=UPI000B8D7D4F|nr:LLM class flavin-dependent oxidoreductase [Cellulomonas sp. PSBB021]ASR55107.1 hypothetical protein CBP52_08425 [Cellulomonas sp. PSBB021]